jgi:gamma-glutamylcyclotransferase (GGCT)/AIG2-like uncharacterized protein YtfP
MKVFVYGTLKRGCSNNYHLRNAVFLGEATTVEPFAMVNVGFPFMIRQTEGAHPVKGELYDIGDDKQTLSDLDRLEGEGRMYDRVTGYVWCGGDHVYASFYVRCEGRPVHGALMTPGRFDQLEWLPHRAEWIDDYEADAEDR